MKYSLEFKLECINKYRNGDFIILPSGLRSRDGFMTHVRTLAKTYDDLGIDGLKNLES